MLAEGAPRVRGDRRVIMKWVVIIGLAVLVGLMVVDWVEMWEE